MFLELSSFINKSYSFFILSLSKLLEALSYIEDLTSKYFVVNKDESPFSL